MKCHQTNASSHQPSHSSHVTRHMSHAAQTPQPSNLPRVLSEYRKQIFDIWMMGECSPAHAGLKYRGGKRTLINLMHRYRKAAMEGLDLKIVSRHSRNKTRIYIYVYIYTLYIIITHYTTYTRTIYLSHVTWYQTKHTTSLEQRSARL